MEKGQDDLYNVLSQYTKIWKDPDIKYQTVVNARMIHYKVKMSVAAIVDDSWGLSGRTPYNRTMWMHTSRRVFDILLSHFDTNHGGFGEICNTLVEDYFLLDFLLRYQKVLTDCLCVMQNAAPKDEIPRIGRNSAERILADLEVTNPIQQINSAVTMVAYTLQVQNYYIVLSLEYQHQLTI